MSGRSDHKNRTIFIYGHHAVAAALANRRRVIRNIFVTDRAAESIKSILPEDRQISVREVNSKELQQRLPAGVPHQGIMAEVLPLKSVDLKQLLQAGDHEQSIVLVLDQITDPHNIGAIFRVAAAFSATAVITTQDHTARESGVMAKAASGALDMVPWVRLPNLARALNALERAGYWRIGLDAEAEMRIGDYEVPEKCAIVLGAEGSGLRRLTRDHCDLMLSLPINPVIGSLNVSNAAAIALYALRTG